MTTPADIAEQLRATSFLDGFSDAHLWKLARHVTPHELVADSTIFNEGEARQRFAILLSGAVAIEKSADGRSRDSSPSGPAKPWAKGCSSTTATTARPRA